MNGCKMCPAHGECTVTYRGPFCAILRRTYSIDDDPEIVTNADRIRAMSDEELATDLLDMFEEICEDGMPSKEWMMMWLRQPVGLRKGENG